jgi:hypothetical protein
VIVVEARDLKKMDAFGKNDVYVSLTIPGSSNSQRTVTVEGGGAAPTWGGGVGEGLAFLVPVCPASVQLQAFDEDVASDDDLIGTEIVSFASHAEVAFWAQEAWVQLQDAKGKPSGQLKIKVACPPPRSR